MRHTPLLILSLQAVLLAFAAGCGGKETAKAPNLAKQSTLYVVG
jgi:hypothetical protein